VLRLSRAMVARMRMSGGQIVSHRSAGTGRARCWRRRHRWNSCWPLAITYVRCRQRSCLPSGPAPLTAQRCPKTRPASAPERFVIHRSSACPVCPLPVPKPAAVTRDDQVKLHALIVANFDSRLVRDQ
jgi:hypothetical protein